MSMLSRVHIHTRTSITNQIVRVLKLKARIILGTGTSFPKIWYNKWIDLTDRVDVPVVETIGDGITTTFGLGTMLEDYHVGSFVLA